MRFLVLTPPGPVANGGLASVAAGIPVKVIRFDARAGEEGVGLIEAHSRHDAEELAEKWGQCHGNAAQLLPLSEYNSRQ